MAEPNQESEVKGTRVIEPQMSDSWEREQVRERQRITWREKQGIPSPQGKELRFYCNFHRVGVAIKYGLPISLNFR